MTNLIQLKILNSGSYLKCSPYTNLGIFQNISFAHSFKISFMSRLHSFIKYSTYIVIFRIFSSFLVIL